MKDPLSLVLKEKSHDLCKVTQATSIADCVDKMNERKIGSLLVMDGEELVGIFTERDVLHLANTGKDFKNTKVIDVMTKKLIYASPNTTVEEAMATFTEKRFRHLPIMDDGKLVGLISIGDLTRWIVEVQKEEIKSLKDYVDGNYR